MLGRRPNETMYQSWSTNIQKMYAPFLLSILVALFLGLGTPGGTWDLMFKTLPTTLTLTFAWGWSQFCYSPWKVHPPPDSPWSTYNEYICVEGINEPAWFLSTLAAFWILFPPIFRFVRGTTQARVIALLIVTVGLNLFYPLFTASSIVANNPTFNEWGGPFQTIQSYHPVSHLHKFVMGMCTARMFIDTFCRPKRLDDKDGKLYISETLIKKVPEAAFFAPFAWFMIILMFFCWYEG